MLAADICQQRQPASYLAESEAEVSNILNPQLGDLAIVSTADGTALYRLRDPSEVPDDAYVVPSNRCSSVWVLSGPDDGGGGAGNITAARINALMEAGRTVVIPEGTFDMDELLIAPTEGEVLIVGEGGDRSILDFTSAPDGTAFTGTGSLTAIPTVNTITIGDVVVTFVAAHTLSERDAFVVENTTDGSFNSARPIYHAGEWFEVAEVLSATQVRLTQPAYATYTAGVNISAWKLNPTRIRIVGVGMRFKEAQGAGVAGIQISLGRGIVLDDLDLSGSQYAQAFLDRCYNVRAENVSCFDNQTTIGNNYGLAFANSQHVRIITCSGETLRHVITFGGGIADGAAVNRDIQIIGGDYSTVSGAGALGNSWAVDFHGNCEHYQLIGVQCPGGLGLGGDNGTITGGRYGNGNLNGTAIVFTEMCGWNFSIGGSCTCYASRNFNNGLLSIYARESLDRASTLDIGGLTIDTGTFASDSYGGGGTIGVIEFGVEGVPANDDITANFDDITVKTDLTAAGLFYAIQYVSDITLGVPSGIKNISITNLKSTRAGILMSGDSEHVVIENCIIPHALAYGIRVTDKGATVAYTSQRWTIRNNNVAEAQRDGIFFGGDTSYSIAIIEQNLSFNCGQLAAATYYSIRVDGVDQLYITRNSVGDIQAVATQAGVYSLSDYTNVEDVMQNNLGEFINPALVRLIDGSGTLHDDPPFDGPQWNYTVSGFEWGAAGASATIPYLFRRDSNNFVQWQFQNKVAAGNPSAAMAISVVGGAVGNSSSGSMFAAAQDNATTHRAGMFGLLANSDADGIILDASSASKVVNAYAGTTGHRALGLFEPANAGETSLLCYSFDASAERIVKTGAAGTGPGGVGRALYVD